MLVRGLDGDDGVGEDGEGTFGMLAKYFAETEAVSEEVTGDKTEEKPSVVNSEQVGWLVGQKQVQSGKEIQFNGRSILCDVFHQVRKQV